MAAAVLTGASALGQTLRNPSFEETETVRDNPYGDLAAHWGRWGNWMNRETKWVPTRTGECLIGYHHWQIQESSSSGLFQDVAGVPAGTNCEFAVYLYKDEMTDCEYVELRIEPYGGGQTVASRRYNITELKEKTWARIHVRGAARTDGLRVLIVAQPRVGAERHGCVKFDDAELLLE